LRGPTLLDASRHLVIFWADTYCHDSLLCYYYCYLLFVIIAKMRKGMYRWWFASQRNQVEFGCIWARGEGRVKIYSCMCQKFVLHLVRRKPRYEIDHFSCECDKPRRNHLMTSPQILGHRKTRQMISSAFLLLPHQPSTYEGMAEERIEKLSWPAVQAALLLRELQHLHLLE